MIMHTVVLFAAISAAIAQNCQPVNFYLIRHTERYLDGFLPPNEYGIRNWDAMLTDEGLQHAERLRDKFMQDGLPLDAIYVTEVAYSYSTALFLAREFEVPIYPYYQEFSLPEGSGVNNVIATIRTSNPCPQSVLIVNHGFTLRGILREVGYTGPELPADDGPFHFARFGLLYNVFINADGTDVFTRLDFGIRGVDDLPTPCLPPFATDERFVQKQPPIPPQQRKIAPSLHKANAAAECITPHLYSIRHTERYGIGFTDTAFYPANYGAVLTPGGFEHAAVLVQHFLQNISLPIDAIFVNVGYNYQVAMELAMATHLPIYVFYTELELFPGPVIPSDVIERIGRLDPCPEGVLVSSHGEMASFPIMQDYGWQGDPPALINFFGSFNHLQRFADGTVTLEETDFGGLRGTADPPRPCNP